jgi:hypothetical protein
LTNFSGIFPDIHCHTGNTNKETVYNHSKKTFF